jgi:hypothetical protein
LGTPTDPRPRGTETRAGRPDPAPTEPADLEPTLPPRTLQPPAGPAGPPPAPAGRAAPDPAAPTEPEEMAPTLPPPAPRPRPAPRPVSDPYHVLSVPTEYRLLERIGAGAFGEVWRAEAPGGTEVALKIIFRPLDQAEAQRELQALEHVKRLRHPYLVQTQACYTVGDRLHIVMDLADGSLRDLAGAGGTREVSLPELLRYFREAAEALDFLHEQGVHHRDIKPANILLQKGHVRVADFGLARPLQTETSLESATLGGTPCYMAPEVWQHHISPHSDQWSLAATYAELRLKRRLFVARDLVAVQLAILQGTFDLAGIDPKEQQVLRRALHTDPRRRYPTCGAFVRDLEEALRPPDEARPPPPKGRRAGAALLLAALLAAAAAGAYLIPRPPPPAPEPRLALAAPGGAVEVGTGRQAGVPVRIERTDFAGPVRLTCDDPPRGITVEEVTAAEWEDEVTVRVAAAADAEPRACRLHLRADGGGVSQTAELDLAVLFLPPGLEPAGDEVFVDPRTGGRWYGALARPVGGGIPPVRFLLISPGRGADAAEPAGAFYVMQDKVTLGLYRKFARETGGELPEVKWPTNDRQPVLGLLTDEAHACAAWLGGRLPSAGQWDKAAGRFLPGRRGEGPYEGIWTEGKQAARARDLGLLLTAPGSLAGSLAWRQPEVAVALPRDGAPWEVGRARDDGSPFGCRDMAGNGQEWTRTTTGTEEVPVRDPQSDDSVWTRGRDFRAGAPLTYQELAEFRHLFRPVQYKLSPGQEQKVRDLAIGFRVVLEPPAPRP